mmetsp:Transcript_104325/g.304547  ORF Transcript_104325/g.304547 Transcript_104325/m.304547 type:complete len:288 (-) Transcript_104325:151-1014(-)
MRTPFRSASRCMVGSGVCRCQCQRAVLRRLSCGRCRHRGPSPWRSRRPRSQMTRPARAAKARVVPPMHPRARTSGSRALWTAWWTFRASSGQARRVDTRWRRWLWRRSTASARSGSPRTSTTSSSSAPTAASTASAAGTSCSACARSLPATPPLWASCASQCWTSPRAAPTAKAGMSTCCRHFTRLPPPYTRCARMRRCDCGYLQPLRRKSGLSWLAASARIWRSDGSEASAHAWVVIWSSAVDCMNLGMAVSGHGLCGRNLERLFPACWKRNLQSRHDLGRWRCPN